MGPSRQHDPPQQMPAQNIPTMHFSLQILNFFLPFILTFITLSTTTYILNNLSQRFIKMEVYVDDMNDDRDTLRSSSITSTSTIMSDIEIKFITNSDSDASYKAVSSYIQCDAPFGVKKSGEANSHGVKKTSCGSESSIEIEHYKLPKATTKLMLDDLNFVQRLGTGDIGTVYLVDLKASRGCYFAAKVMDKEELAYRNKEGRAGTEREILEMLDHPFLPTLHATLECPRWSCLLTEFCPGGDLHVLRQRQPDKRFNEDVVR